MSVLSWFAGHPASFWLVALAALAAFLALATWPAPAAARRRKLFEAAFCGVGALTFIAWRWPVFISWKSLNPDEGQMVANALKATVDIVPWRGFDGTTSGPLNSDVLALAALTGAHIDFFSARVVGAVLILGALFALYLAARWTYGGDVARIALVPPLLFFALVRDTDIVQYSSEYLSFFLTTAALACGAYLIRRDADGRRRVLAVALGGVCIGCAPFAKLQIVPIVAVNAAFLLYAVAVTRRDAGARWKAEAVAGVAGIAAPAVLILGAVVLAGEWNDFVISYLRFALLYVAGTDAVDAGFFFGKVPQYATFLVAAAIAVVGCVPLLLIAKPRDAASRVVGWFSLGFVAASVLAIYEPHRLFAHYLLLSVLPIGWCVANVIGQAAPALSSAAHKRWLGSAFVLAVALLSLQTYTTKPDAFIRDLAQSATWPHSPEGLAIQRYAKRGDPILVWGWVPEYYVETGTIMATRDAHTVHQIDSGPYQAYFRDRLMRDLALRPPRVIVDAVAKGAFAYNDPATAGIQTFPALAALVRERYVLSADVGGIRVYRLRGAPR